MILYGLSDVFNVVCFEVGMGEIDGIYGTKYKVLKNNGFSQVGDLYIWNKEIYNKEKNPPGNWFVSKKDLVERLKLLINQINAS